MLGGVETARNGEKTARTDEAVEATVNDSDVTRVRRPRAAAAGWYDALSPWYGPLADPFEARYRGAGLDLLAPAPGERAVDVGAGPGRALVALARAVGPRGRAVGVDLSSGMCRVARRRARAAAVSGWVDLVRGDAVTLPLRDGVADAVFCSFTLELFDTPDVPAVLAEWRRVLGGDGRVAVVSLDRGDAGAAVRVYERLHGWFPRYLDCRPIHVGRALSAGGFSVVERRDFEPLGLPVAVVLAEPD